MLIPVNQKIQLTNQPLDLEALRDWSCKQGLHQGAVSEFTGYVRDNVELGRLEYLQIEHYPPMSLASLQTIAREFCTPQILGLCLVHRYGKVDIGHPIVYVAVSSTHRQQAFRVCQAVVEALKTHAMLWKREVGSHGSQWLNPPVSEHFEAGDLSLEKKLPGRTKFTFLK